MTTTSTETWESKLHAHALDMIATGEDRWDELDKPTFTSDEWAEMLTLEWDADKAIRAACSHIEDDLRNQYPEAGRLARALSRGAADRHLAAVEALTDAESAAYDTLCRLHNIRRQLKKVKYPFRPTPRPTPSTDYTHIWADPADMPPVVQRLLELKDQATDRWREHNRDRGRKLLEELDSGQAWQEQLEQRRLATCAARNPETATES